jgi:hypothetical protein
MDGQDNGILWYYQTWTLNNTASGTIGSNHASNIIAEKWKEKTWALHAIEQRE